MKRNQDQGIKEPPSEKTHVRQKSAKLWPETSIGADVTTSLQGGLGPKNKARSASDAHGMCPSCDGAGVDEVASYGMDGTEGMCVCEKCQGNRESERPEPRGFCPKNLSNRMNKDVTAFEFWVSVIFVAALFFWLGWQVCSAYYQK